MKYNNLDKATMLITYSIEKASNIAIAVDCFNSISPQINNNTYNNLCIMVDQYLQ